MNSCHSWCRTHKLSGARAGLGYFCRQPRHTRIFPVMNARVKGLESGDVEAQRIRGGGGGGTMGMTLL